MPPAPSKSGIETLLEIMARLRAPDGCPWDREQTHQSLKRYLVEESAELLDAIDDGNDARIIDELGDVLLQVVFHCRIAEEQGRFDFDQVARHCAEKLIRRHPHVFGDRQVKTSAEVLEVWKEVKWEEQKKDQEQRTPTSVIDGVPNHLPALHRAWKIQKKAARVGFDWPSIDGAMAKVEEELGEVRTALEHQDAEAAGAEIGDLLFAVVNLSRFLDADPEDRLRQTIRKFERRFHEIERRLREQGRPWSACDLAELDALWNEAKAAESAPPSPEDAS